MELVISVIVLVLCMMIILIKGADGKPGNNIRYVIDSYKLQRELSREPSLNFDDGIITIDKKYYPH